MKAVRLIIALATALCFSPLITTASAGDEAVVTSATLPVHADITSESAVVKTLHGGETVVIDFEVDGKEGKWCFVTEPRSFSMGYVLCDRLALKADVGRRAPSAGDAGDAALRQYSDIRVVMYMTDW